MAERRSLGERIQMGNEELLGGSWLRWLVLRLILIGTLAIAWMAGAGLGYFVRPADGFRDGAGAGIGGLAGLGVWLVAWFWFFWVVGGSVGWKERRASRR